MKVGLFFGSFNPVHQGHLEIANYFLSNTDLKEIWFVVSPQNPLKDDAELLDVENRLELVYAAIDEDESIKCCEIELGLPMPSYSVDTLRELSGKYPNNHFVILMGTDNMEKFNLWKEYEAILEQYEIYVYPRTGSSAARFENHPSVTLIDSELLEVSASMLREQIRKGEYNQWLPNSVAEIIREKGYYEASN